MIAYSDVFFVYENIRTSYPNQKKHPNFHQQIAGHLSSSLQWLFPKVIWLVVDLPLLKIRKLVGSWDDYSQYMEKWNWCSKHFQTTNQNGYFPKSSIPPIKSRYQHARGCRCRVFGFPDEYMEGPPNPSSLWSIQQLNIKWNIYICFTMFYGS